MDSIAYIVAAVADRAVEKSAQATPRRGWLMRLMTALHDSRRRQAQRVIERHAHFFSDGDGHLDRPATSDACDRDVPFWWAPPT